MVWIARCRHLGRVEVNPYRIVGDILGIMIMRTIVICKASILSRNGATALERRAGGNDLALRGATAIQDAPRVGFESASGRRTITK
jgi:hypothetical protein